MIKLKLRAALVALMLMCAYTLNASVNCKYENLIHAIMTVESNHNADCVSKSGKHVGILQISKCVVDDCNRILGEKRFSYRDRYNVDKSVEMFYIYQEYYNRSGNLEKAIRIWNGGSNYTKAGTEKYYRKVWREYLKIKG